MLESLRDQKPRITWFEFSAGLFAMLLFGVGGGGFSLLIVGFLEKQSGLVTEIGSVQSLISIVEVCSSLLVGHFYRGKWTREILILGTLLNGASALILSFQPSGVMIWLGAALTGAGFGIVVVIMYVAVIERRPPGMKMGLVVGLYTACIAAGNGMGDLSAGWITDGFGFRTAFLFCVACYVTAVPFLCFLKPRSVIASDQSVQTPARDTQDLAEPAAASAWIMAMLTGFSLAAANVVYDTLFPVYALRAGISFTLIGVMGGLKMVLAGLVRPIVGMAIAGNNLSKLNSVSLTGLCVGTLLIPFSGFGVGLAVVAVILGLSFGAVRTTSAALAIIGESDQSKVSRKISYYNTCITAAQTVSPWLVSQLASRVEISRALIVAPAIVFAIFIVGSTLSYRFLAHHAGKPGKTPSCLSHF